MVQADSDLDIESLFIGIIGHQNPDPGRHKEYLTCFEL